nr:hypothetical protein [Tanacetum cinerariifolium]
ISLPEYEAFSFYDDHIEEISSGSTTTTFDISLPEYDSFIIDLPNDQFPSTDRSDFTHEEFGDKPAHIISPPEYECFYFRDLPDLGELISSLNSEICENLSSTIRLNLPIKDDHSPLLAYVVWIFLAYLTRVVPTNYDPKGERFLIASRFPTPPLAWNVEDKILVPKPPKNCARCARCGYPVDGPYCQGCALLRKELEEDLVTHFQDFQNTSESFDDNINVVNAPREPFVVKQGKGSFVDKLIYDLHTFSPNQRHCFHCKDMLRDEFSNDSLISANSSHNPPHIDEHYFECDDSLDGIFCQRCACKSCGKGAHIGYNCPPKVPIISNPEPYNQTMNNEPPQTLPSFDSTCYSDKEISVPCVSKPNFVDESSNIFNPPPQPPIYSCKFYGSNAQYGHYCTPQASFINPEPGYNQDFNFP